MVHCHNLLPLISPAAYYACQAEGVPVVQTLHNFRLRCPAGTLFRKDAACQDCDGGLGRAVVRGCYRNSRIQTAAVALMLGTHRALGRGSTRSMHIRCPASSAWNAWWPAEFLATRSRCGQIFS